ncbi:MAG: hypothetical protein ACPGOV_09265 [Magnetovibrionaceae bacterium]
MSDVIVRSALAAKTTKATVAPVATGQSGSLSSTRPSAASSGRDTNDETGNTGRALGEAGPDAVAQRVSQGLEQARARADALEQSLKEGKADLDRDFLERLDKLLDTYLLLATFAAARGDGGGVKWLSEQAARFAGDAPERLQRIGEVAQTNAETKEGDPLGPLTRISTSISVKLLALSYRADAAPGGEADREAVELRELAFATDKAGETGPARVSPDTVADLLRKAAESVGISREDLTAKLSSRQPANAVFVSEQV